MVCSVPNVVQDRTCKVGGVVVLCAGGSALTNSSAVNKGAFLGGISIESKNSNNSKDDNYNGGSRATILNSTPLNRTHWISHLGLAA